MREDDYPISQFGIPHLGRLFNFYGSSEEGDDGQHGHANEQRRQ
jgi:hypothetical protein